MKAFVRDVGKSSGSNGNASNKLRDQVCASRRRLLFSGASFFGLPDLLAPLKSELSLWNQEVEIYRRRATGQIKELLGQNTRSPEGQPLPSILPLNVELAEFLLAAPLDVLNTGRIIDSWNQTKYASDASALQKQELPYFKKNFACGRCSEEPAAGSSALADRDWFDFLSYIQFKAIARQLPNDAARDTTAMGAAVTAFERMHQGLEYDRYTPETSLTEETPAINRFRDALDLHLLSFVIAHSEGDALQSLHSSSPGLANIRRGVRTILDWYRSKGFIAQYGILFFGASKLESRNYYVWARGEPAYLKYWLRDAATLRSSAALQLEQGYSQEIVAGTLRAYLRQCGVGCGPVRRFPSYLDPGLVAEQCTLRRAAPLADGELDAEPEGEPFLLDPCTDGVCF